MDGCGTQIYVSIVAISQGMSTQSISGCISRSNMSYMYGRSVLRDRILVLRDRLTTLEFINKTNQP